MLTSATKFVWRLMLPTCAFLFVGVPLESYVRGMEGYLTIDGDWRNLIFAHLFGEAAACFYCITVLLECLLVLTRPHVRSHPRIPVTPITMAAVVLTALLVVAYVYIRLVSDVDIYHASALLIVGMIATILIFAVVHIIDFVFSDAVSTPPPGGATAAG